MIKEWNYKLKLYLNDIVLAFNKSYKMYNNNDKIIYLNYANPTRAEEWISQFIEYYYGESLSKKIAIYGVFGSSKILKRKSNRIKIFFSGENLIQHNIYNTLSSDKLAEIFLEKRYKDFNEKILSDMNLSLGFIESNGKNMFRFPLWIIYFFKPDSTYQDIKERVEFINNIKSIANINKAVVINSHDNWGIRTKICDDLNDTLDIVYAGKWRNNTNDLWKKYNNDKIKYVSNFKFNICAENMDAPGYVTEKIFESYLAGSIPIYIGSNNNPEPDIILKDNVILWDCINDNYDNLKFIKKLNKDEKFYYKYFNRPKLSKYASEYIYDYIYNLKKHLDLILK